MSDPPSTAMRWVPLESNPEVLNAWSSKAGLVTSEFQYSDVFGLDDELLDLVPRPVKAVILLFPLTDSIERRTQDEITFVREQGQHSIDPSLVWIKQTIGNACGTMGLLHAIINSSVPVVPDSPIAKFITEITDLTPVERARLLETTSLFSNIHAEAANAGQTAAPDANSHTNLHFTCYVAAADPEAPFTKRLIELDGRRDGPVDRGPCSDLLKDAARVIKDNYVDQAGSVQFSMLALAPPSEF